MHVAQPQLVGDRAAATARQVGPLDPDEHGTDNRPPPRLGSRARPDKIPSTYSRILKTSGNMRACCFLGAVSGVAS